MKYMAHTLPPTEVELHSKNLVEGMSIEQFVHAIRTLGTFDDVWLSSDVELPPELEAVFDELYDGIWDAVEDRPEIALEYARALIAVEDEQRSTVLLEVATGILIFNLEDQDCAVYLFRTVFLAMLDLLKSDPEYQESLREYLDAFADRINEDPDIRLRLRAFGLQDVLDEYFPQPATS